MTIEQRLKNLESRFDALQRDFIQAQKNGVSVTAKADEVPTLSTRVTEITPYTATKTAYIDDIEVTFENVPTGILTVSCEVEHTAERQGDAVTINFEPLDRVIDVTIMVQ